MHVAVLINNEWESMTRDQREQLFHDEISAGRHPASSPTSTARPPDGSASNPAQAQLARTRGIDATAQEPVDG
ncbi:hypothetical protein [Microbacterium tumbae]